MKLIGLFATAGLCLGLSHFDGSLGLLAWPGIALLAYALSQDAPPRLMALGLLAQFVLALWVGHPWQLATANHYLPGGLEVALPGALLYTLIFSPPTLLLWATWRLLGRWPAYVWLAPAWIMGEQLHDAAVGVTHNAWLYSQWQIQPVLRLVGGVGWHWALWICLTQATLVGVAIAQRSKWPLAVSVLGIGGLLLLPPLPSRNDALVADVGALHLQSYAHIPKQVPTGVRLLVWPEQLSNQRPRLREGCSQGELVWLPTKQAGVSHLYGVLTRVAEGLQNSLLTVDDTGHVISSRAKRRLMAWMETPWMGILLSGGIPLVAGSAPPVLDIADRKVVGLLCYEGFDLGLGPEGRDYGGQVMTISARETILEGSRTGMQQMLGIAVLRAVQTGLPVVRASLYGQAAIIGSDGRILALSEPGTDGILTVSSPRH